MDMTTEKMEYLARQAATEAELPLLRILWVQCDSNLMWEVTFADHSNVMVTVIVDTHDFNNEDVIRHEIKRQILGRGVSFA